ncbi:MAG: hypothetical protein ACOYNZ_03120 [Rhodoferax sp.]
MRWFAMHRVRQAISTYRPMIKQMDVNLSEYVAKGYGDFGDGGLRDLDTKSVA